jgi:hypothetical protein
LVGATGLSARVVSTTVFLSINHLNVHLVLTVLYSENFAVVRILLAMQSDSNSRNFELPFPALAPRSRKNIARVRRYVTALFYLGRGSQHLSTLSLISLCTTVHHVVFRSQVHNTNLHYRREGPRKLYQGKRTDSKRPPCSVGLGTDTQGTDTQDTPTPMKEQ